ncbi:glycosyltransferase family 4 protein [Yeosuana marina]|uniref:glycosyltransferase family 4 protein n=1 Tax=Yeosuana marina TaxID=1565536 RepID=UPI0014216418|nr:glycosyltransferase family 4 protein [Yeosuana marina]
MRVLQINKFLYNMGGAETYMFKLSEALKELGHEVKFWGMKHSKNIIEDEFDCFADCIEFYELSSIQKITATHNTIYSKKNIKKINYFLDQWMPDIVHIHNYNFQLTPSILKVFHKRNIKVVQTIHDSQMVCPYHRLYNFQRESTCVKCVEGSFSNCIKDKCFDNSLFKSTIGALESYLYHGLNYYNKYINHYISPSQFLKNLVSKRVNQTIEVIPNFVDVLLNQKELINNKDSYFLYYGRVSKEKGIIDIIPILEKLKLNLYIVGNGDEVSQIKQSEYITYLGPKYGEELFSIIANAKYVIQPSKWFENCPMTIVESFSLGVPVIGANHSGFKELIEDGATGFILDFTNKETLEDELLRVDSLYTEALRQQAYKFYVDTLSKQQHLTKVVKIYESLLT